MCRKTAPRRLQERGGAPKPVAFLPCGVPFRLVSATVPSMRTVEIPAPTAASVKATSTASRVTNRSADNRLKTPKSMMTANRCPTPTIASAVAASMVNRKILIQVSGMPCSMPGLNDRRLVCRQLNPPLPGSGPPVPDSGRSPDTSAALASAWVAVGPVMSRNKPMITSLTVTSDQPPWIHMPASRSSTPAESRTESA